MFSGFLPHSRVALGRIVYILPHFNCILANTDFVLGHLGLTPGYILSFVPYFRFILGRIAYLLPYSDCILAGIDLVLGRLCLVPGQNSAV
ncbi:MAG: hypothetical protein H6Q17_2832 [Bacteroidetes bacterium]|nr:hypothetical protein [Bacteroidota bacterium]